MISFGIIIIISGFITLFFNQYHLLKLLLCFEFMYLGILCLGLFFFCGYENMTGLMMFLLLIVCEASMGLSLMVYMVGYYGNESMKILSAIFC
uniref:NADH dehydrogenase subunit 4L n=1 Tax=Nuttalliella namaqua TaxID=1029659 RepID=K7QMW4_9ACAR|nr:NADH dehydrogenase subunit 4L [Nuttalliella namaqua]AFV32087.1 NADH dehydrogenase subunit 4L [Nuttalliella namaqua]